MRSHSSALEFKELKSEPSFSVTLYCLHFKVAFRCVSNESTSLTKVLCSLISFSKVFAGCFQQSLEYCATVQNGDSAVSLHHRVQETRTKRKRKRCFHDYLFQNLKAELEVKKKSIYFWGKCPALWLGQLSILTESVLFFVVAQMLEFLNIVIECQTVTSSVWSDVSVAFPDSVSSLLHATCCRVQSEHQVRGVYVCSDLLPRRPAREALFKSHWS